LCDPSISGGGRVGMTAAGTAVGGAAYVHTRNVFGGGGIAGGALYRGGRRLGNPCSSAAGGIS
jgi:hypothetical protein